MGNERNNRRNTKFWGFSLIVIGCLFFFETIELFDMGDLISTFWPVALICVGVWIIVSSRKDRQRGSDRGRLFTTGDGGAERDSERGGRCRISSAILS